MNLACFPALFAGSDGAKNRGCNWTQSGDTGGQWPFPITATCGNNDGTLVFTTQNAVLYGYRRSRLGSLCLCGFCEFSGFFITGDTGVCGKHFGKVFGKMLVDFRDTEMNRVAWSWYEYTKHERDGGGCD